MPILVRALSNEASAANPDIAHLHLLLLISTTALADTARDRETRRTPTDTSAQIYCGQPLIRWQ